MSDEGFGGSSPPDDYRRRLHDAAMKAAKEAVASGLAGRDAHLMQAVKALDDLNEAFNVLSERLAEWYMVLCPGHQMRPVELIDFILKEGLPEEDSVIKGLASTAKALNDERKALEGYIKAAMEEIAPNLSNVAGPILGARLIARAGGLEKLAKMPASSIQVMGAGEALFKHLKAGTPPPKHGLIYKHPLVKGASKKARGKISRMLASKAAIAARVDFYSGETVDLGDLKEKAAAIKAKGRKKHECR
ncbi:Protein implicated in ribosomal biogenesis, Nop56p-like protein [Methanocella conradii HZ254]|uniref:Protein implicated in ribosomal biogenesis, Nop56p-like protein n=1 Tax=Methanocella conradii (strain DSM 24694 / JCM 17849 / CGMCC 1.5162 / HZ254) TaxID=1041930 RepID=H8I9U0_METCZ|nr:NOP5/NOP56 family protein [Methanocella conradii]AFD00541.1 Protein implicated in ribosomal biogenesis, Nop56p-like protein [Methanocella conradii HZ254]